MRVVPLLFSSVSGRKNVLIHYIIKSKSPVIQTNYRTFAFVRVELVVLVTLISPKTTNRLLLDFHISFVYG